MEGNMNQRIRNGNRSHDFPEGLDHDTVRWYRDRLGLELRNTPQLNVVGAKMILDQIRVEPDADRDTIERLYQEICRREISEINIQGILLLLDEILL
jgi:hypothetical protein